MDKKKQEFDLVAVGDEISNYVEKYWKVVLGVILVGVGGFSVVLGMKKAKANGEKEAFVQLYAITEIYETRKKEFDEAKAEEEAKKAEAKNPKAKKDDKKTAEKKEEPPKQKASGDMDKDYGDVVEKLQAYIQKTPDKKATAEAALTLSSIYSEYEEKEKAAEVVSKVADKWNQSDLISLVLNMRAGDLWSMVDKCDRAVTYWTKISGGKNFLREDALLKSGLCQQKLGNLEKAKSLYQQVIALSPLKASAADPSNPFAAMNQPQTSQNAQKFLRFLQFQEKLGKGEQSQNNKNNNDKES